MRISTAAHPTEYCRSAPPLNAFPRIPVTLGLPCSPENEEVPHGEKDQGQGGPEAEVGERAFAERDRPHRPRLEAQRPGRAGSREGAGRLLGGRRGDVRGGRLRAAVPRQGRRRAGARRPRLGTRPPRAREDRRVTLKLLHAEYADGCAEAGAPSMSYDRFCKRYRQYTVSRNVVSRVGHKAGRNMEVDWSGPTMRLVDPATGEVRKVYLFVACLPFSRYSYVEPTLDMKQDTWLLCHVHAFSFLGGATPCIVPDNLRTGVTAHPRAGEPVLNAAYEELAAHYGSAVIPARVRRPRDKPSAENEVWAAATYVIAALRDEVFTDMAALRAAVARRVAEHNDAPFAKREGSRREVFEEVERPLLRPLPAEPFEVCEWVYGRKVQANCHVAYARNYYSVSHLLVGSTVGLRVTEGKVEVFSGGERVATHPRFPSYARNRYSTRGSDMPEGRAWSDWDAPRIRAWASRVGPSCSELVDRVFACYEFDEQGFNAALAVLRLSRRYTPARLERACGMALATGKRSPRYRDVEPVLRSGQDRAPAGEASGDCGYVRGAGFYGEE